MNDALHSMRDPFILVFSPQTSSAVLTLLHLHRILTTQRATLQLARLTEIITTSRAPEHRPTRSEPPPNPTAETSDDEETGGAPAKTARAAATAAASRSREIPASTNRDSDTNFESPELAIMTSSGSVIFSAPAASPAPM